MDQFANDTPEQRDEAFQEAAARLGLSKAIVEKDFWVCWSLKQLFALPSFCDHMIFKGGTSLSKAYDVIHRFSEDVDLSLDRARLGFEGDRDPENPDLSGKKQKQLLQELQDAAEAEVSGPLLAEIQAAFDAGLDQGFSLTVDPGDAQTLLFAYPSLSDSAGGYVKPIVRFEFGARGVHLPAEVREISPYVHQAFPDLLRSGGVDVKVLGVERTFWEKATILHMLYHQGPAKPLADRMSGLILLTRLALPTGVTVILFATALFPLASAEGQSMWLIGFIILAIADTFIFPYQSSYFLKLRSDLQAQDLMHVVDDRRIVAANIALIACRIAAIYGCLAFWTYLDLI